MKKEGTGKPRNPDIALDAGRERCASCASRRCRTRRCASGETPGATRCGRAGATNLPDEVQEGVVYRDAGIRLRIATEIVEGPSDLGNSSDAQRVKTNLEVSGKKTVEQEPQNEKEQK